MTQIPSRVLIVDDYSVHLDILERAFIQLGTPTIVKASDGYEARDLLNEAGQQFDLMVLDLCLPGFDGFEVLNYLIQYGSRTRLIFLSGMPRHILDMAEKLSKKKELNVVGTLQKPISISELMDLVKQQDWENQVATNVSEEL